MIFICYFVYMTLEFRPLLTTFLNFFFSLSKKDFRDVFKSGLNSYIGIVKVLFFICVHFFFWFWNELSLFSLILFIFFANQKYDIYMWVCWVFI